MRYTHEMEIGKEGMAYATIEATDCSFDHEFGTKKQTGHEVTEFCLIYYVDGVWETDVTKSLTDKTLEYYKELILNDYIQKVVAA